jgi:uncharacterized protein (TIGR03790 family)
MAMIRLNPNTQAATLVRSAYLTATLACAVSMHGQVPVLDPQAEGPQAVVVYNSKLAESRELAAYYAARRGVPTNQVFGFDLPTDETISRRDFQVLLQGPLLQALETNGLFSIDRPSPPSRRADPQDQPVARVVAAQVRYLALCYGVPLRILPEPGLIDAAHARLPEQLRRNEAAVDSELALLPASLQGLPITGPITNPAYGRTNTADLHPTNGVLVVGRLDGPTVEIARGLIDKAMVAETNGLWGRAYIDLRGTTDQNLQLGERWLSIAADMTRRIGYETVIDTRPETFPAEFPMSHIAFYAGWYDNHVSGPFTRHQVEFMPGAIAYHLHSFSAVSVRSPNRYWVGPFLAQGVTATFGTVAEPYLELTPDLSIFLPSLIGRAFSFGEAATVAQPVLSWQVTVIGDPLYRPFGRIEPGSHIGERFRTLHQALRDQNSPWFTWSLLQVSNLRLVLGEPETTLIAEFQSDPLVAQSSILQEKLGDLYNQTGKLASAIRSYERALALQTSPQQRTRLTLNLADLLSMYARERQALDLYQSFLNDVPHYPAPLDIYRKMLPLARRLDQPEEIARIQAAIDRLAPTPTPDSPHP